VANKKHLDQLRHGVQAWNQWRINNPNIRPDLSDAELNGADLSAANLAGVNLAGAHLIKANFLGAKISGANLTSADLSEAKLIVAELIGANLTHANLTAADLGGATLHGANLTQAMLRGARLTADMLSYARLTWADLSGADLAYAHLPWADLTGAILTDTVLRGTDLCRANLSQASLTGADLSEAETGWTVFADLDLSTVKGIESIRHFAPSSIDVATIYRSRGNIPHAFLRGAGMPEAFVQYVASLVGKPTQFYSCFISYSSADQEAATRLHADLQNRAIRCWFAPENLRTGDRFRQRIYEAIRLYEKLLLILSEHSVASDWVRSEVEAAFEKERSEEKDVLFPIRLDDAIESCTEAWAAEIRRTRHVGDFRRWKDHHAYQEAFARLVRDLQAGEG
jgi:uncharacterized protein YjbI with pentapeptide repeats